MFGNLDLPNNIDKAHKLFKYDSESLWFNTESYILKELIKNSHLVSGKFLVFGIGGNIDILKNIKDSKNSKEIWGCDLIERNDKFNYFNTYKDNTKIGMFDGICSTETVEHLDNTIEAWIYMNRLLKPMSKGGGIMIHSFPSNINLHMYEIMVIIGSHTCIFSERSLHILCDKTGFSIKKISFNNFVPEYLFVKIRDL